MKALERAIANREKQQQEFAFSTQSNLERTAREIQAYRDAGLPVPPCLIQLISAQERIAEVEKEINDSVVSHGRRKDLRVHLRNLRTMELMFTNEWLATPVRRETAAQ